MLAVDISSSQTPNEIEPWSDARPRGSLSVFLADANGDAEWDLSIYARGESGPWGLVGKVRTIAPTSTFGERCRIVAVAFVPGAIGWRVTAAPWLGRLSNRPTWSGSITLETSEFLGGCCSLVAVDPFAVKLPLAG